MAIRPVDFQGAIFQSNQTAGTQRAAEQAPLAAQAAVAASTQKQAEEQRQTISETQDTANQRIRERQEREPDTRENKKRRQAGQPFAALDEEAQPLSDGEPHIIDFTA
jgi:hypothetical protein